jgi:hypothetical protein
MSRTVIALAVAAIVTAASGITPSNPGDAEEQWDTLQFDLQNRHAITQRAAQTLNPESLILKDDRDPLDILLRRTAALLTDLKARTDLSAQEKELAALHSEADQVKPENPDARRKLFDRALALRRQIAFSNPLLDFDRILFVKRHRAIYNHMCDQFYGITARPGGGLCILEDAFGPTPKVTDVLASANVTNGRLQGQCLKGGNGAGANLQYDGAHRLSGDETAGGAFLSPALSYDAKEILFAYVECAGDRTQAMHTDAARGHWAEGRCYHIFRVNTDGSNLRQVTDGTWNDFDPCWLPNGRIAFISERRGGYLRCGRACPLYNLYDMAGDGSGINLLSIHDSNEWNPSVTHDGRIVWTRWDYVDRHGCIAHMPWITRLDGTDPRALHGNFAPRPLRADMELGVRAIPGSPKFVATAAPHHGQAFGSLVVIDPRVEDDDAMGPVRRLTPEVGFPESQGGSEVYGTPWPLGENYHLCVYDPAFNGVKTRQNRSATASYGLYLIDAFGNKELIYRDPDIGCSGPIPLRPTPVPPATVDPRLVGEQKPVKPGDEGEATMAVVNVFNTMRPCPTNSVIKELRILQLLPCSVPSGFPPHQTGQRIDGAGDSIVPARWVLGTVPIESDGSAYFKVPANREVFFQLVDERGMAVQSMRSGTAARSGEQLVCQGCHEPKHRAATAQDAAPLAMRRAPSVPRPDADGSNPFSYPRLVQPVLERNCVACHDKSPGKAPNLKKDPISSQWFASYNSLLPYAFTSYGEGYRTIPGRFGAQASRLVALLDKGHHDVKLTPEDFHRLTLWLDCSSIFYGVFEKEPGEAQLRGELAGPTLW